jgi:hypothetical protein
LPVNPTKLNNNLHLKKKPIKLFEITSDKIIRRLRWVMIAVMLFNIVLTLLGQPSGYWDHPETAIRSDGLPIDNVTNHTFEFFLSGGWQVFLLASVLYISGVFFIVSLLPRKLTLIAIFSIIFGYFFGGVNWLAVRWHQGVNGSVLYGLAIALILVLWALPSQSPAAGGIIKKLRWVMAGVMASDMINTLIGQPAGYWQHPKIAHEANGFSHFLLAHGWYTYLFTDLIIFSALIWLVSFLPRPWGLVFIFYFMLVNYIGASNWFFFQWRMGAEVPVIYAVILSAIIVILSFAKTPGPGIGKL